MCIGSKESITNLLLSFYLIWMVTVTANSQTLISTSHGNLLPLHHVVFSSSHRFFWPYQRLGSESVHQKESNGTVSRLWVLNLSLDKIFEVCFFKNIFSGLFQQK